MRPSLLISFPEQNARLLKQLVWLSWLWSLLVVGCNWVGEAFAPSSFWGAFWLALQLFAAGRLFTPAQSLEPVPRQRLFYLFWLLVLLVLNGVLFFLFPYADSSVWVAALKSAFLLLCGTLVGVVLARYIKTLRDALWICVAMSGADFFSWLSGPTAEFTQQITAYYQAPQGMPPLIDMVLIKMAFPGTARLVPVIGVSDWVMVAFFTCVARQFQHQRRLTGHSAGNFDTAGHWLGHYFPIPVVALYGIILLAQSSNLFIPVLPLLAVIMIGWYLFDHFRLRR